jgi:hypothetical protein
MGSRSKVGLILLLGLSLWPAPVAAQEPPPPVLKWADYTRWGTALVNPTWGVVEALRSDHRACHLGQLGISLGVGETALLTIQHFVVSPRPCLGCNQHGLPSGHTMHSILGIDQASPATRWGARVGVGLASVAATGILSVVSHRHTVKQVLWGAGVGTGAELTGHLLHCGP